MHEEIGVFRHELDELRSMIRRVTGGPITGVQRSYNEAVKEKMKENVIIIKPKMQQESEETKN